LLRFFVRKCSFTFSLCVGILIISIILSLSFVSKDIHLAIDRTNQNDAQWTKQAYEQRWNIEVFFKQIKTNGFNLEDMNLKEIDKVRLIMSVVSVAYVLCLKEGLIQNEINPIKL